MEIRKIIKRFLAYKDTLKKYGIAFEPDRIYELNYEVETGLKAFTVFQERGLLPEAFVCANDNIAAGICLAAQDAGYSVPDDFLVTGFDNATRSINFYPPITTVEFSKAHIMYNALCLLADIWNGTDKSSQIFSPTAAYIVKAVAALPSFLQIRENMYPARSWLKPVRETCSTG